MLAAGTPDFTARLLCLSVTPLFVACLIIAVIGGVDVLVDLSWQPLSSANTLQPSTHLPLSPGGSSIYSGYTCHTCHTSASALTEFNKHLLPAPAAAVTWYVPPFHQLGLGARPATEVLDGLIRQQVVHPARCVAVMGMVTLPA